ncbi:MAG: 50S ribosomal protein L35 [Candidatus Delongbacteria bacterium]|jgi:large subunit ribosomal protein L35|nr:50S ribosomal protein L35 [Candidatus Delongbacteria bacterium]MDD4205059.1 50S ribosomal protein L35 [Candidatus Delongbacteria bacterium]MDY0017689.1 50S ribosomal protein L35 [Candidatus Delongbacteria bacterium]
MPKIKSHRAARKRMRLTSSGKVKIGSAFTSHLLTNRSAKRKRKLRRGGILSAVDSVKARQLIKGS